MKVSYSFIFCLINIFTSVALLWILAKQYIEPLRALEFGEIDWRMKTLFISFVEDVVGTLVFLEFGQNWSFKNSGVIYNTAMILFNTAYFFLYKFWRESVPILSFTEITYTLYQYCVKRRQRRRQEQFYLSIHLYRSLLLFLYLIKVLAPKKFVVEFTDAKYTQFLVPIISGIVIFFGLAYQQPFLLLGCFLSLLVLISDDPIKFIGMSSLYSLIALLTVTTGMLIR